MTERQILRFVRSYIAIALPIGFGTIAFLSWHSFPHGAPPAMLPTILLTVAATLALPLLGFALLYLFSDRIGRWVFKNEPKYEDPRF